MAVSKFVIQQRLPFVDGQGRLTNEGLRSLNDTFSSLFSQISQIAELYGITSGLTGDIAGITSAGVLLESASASFPNGLSLMPGTAIGLTPGSGTLTVSFNGDTDDVPEGTSLYFTNARARSALSATAPVNYDNVNGVISLGTVGVGNGGTGITSYTAGDIVFASGAATLSKLAIGASGTVLTSNGSAPVWTASTGTGSIARATKPQFDNTIGVGTAAAASGSGVSFPVTASPSADANTLDDYREGTWTPTVTATGGALTSYTATGSYTKIGRHVHATASINITNNGTGSSAISFTLPFAAGTGPGWVGSGRENAATGNMLQALINSGGSTALVVTYNNGYPAGTGYVLIVTVSYFV